MPTQWFLDFAIYCMSVLHNPHGTIQGTVQQNPSHVLFGKRVNNNIRQLQCKRIIVVLVHTIYCRLTQGMATKVQIEVIMHLSSIKATLHTRIMDWLNTL
jgi:hypothetical protein